MSEQEKINLDAFQQQVQNAVELISFSENLEPLQPRPYSSGFEESKKEAEQIVKRKDIKQIICPALTNVANDTANVVNAITPGLVTAVLAGTLAIPLNPVLFGWIAVVIFKAGVASICTGYDSKE
jgi:hypothetical protein